jgi:hypothetical protein
MAMKTGMLSNPAAAMFEADRLSISEATGERWPLWLRVLTIISLSTGLWAVIIWGLALVFG